jgi:hypothetical protein
MNTSTGIPRHELRVVAEPRDLLGADADAHDVVALARALILGNVGGDAGERAGDFRRRALVESGERDRTERSERETTRSWQN